ncbi:glycosyltransferase family 4 protein [soil metagenome]
MKLLYVAGGFPRLTETFVLNEVLGQLERGHDVRVVSLRPSQGSHPAEAEEIRRRTIDVGRVPLPRRHLRRGASSVPEQRWSRRLFAMAAAANVAARLGGFSPDVVHAHFLNLPKLVAGTLARLLEVPYTFTGHADDFMVDVPDQLLRQRVLHADGGFVVSEAGQREIVRRARLDPDESRRLTVVRASAHRRVAAQGSEPAAPLTLVTVGRLVPIKGIDVSIRAFALVRRRHPRARYWVVGEGPERPKLEELIRSLDLQGSVTLLGSMDNATAQRVLVRSHVAVLACRRDDRGAADGVPVFLMEAGLLGVPVVSTDVAGVPELVRHGRSGLLARPDEVTELADAVLGLAAGGELRARLVSGLRERVETEFAPGRQLDRMHAVWQQLTLDPPPGAA